MENDIYSKKSIEKKILQTVLKILYNILIIICLILIAIIVFQKITDSDKSIAGYRIFRVITGSMIPQYDIGEVVVSKETNPNDIKVGDDIVYRGTYGEYNGKIIMHKVIKVERDANNNLIFHAQGLNENSVEDPQIKASQIYGVVKFKSMVLTILYNLATNIYTAFVIIFILVLNVFLAFKFSGKEEVQQLGEAVQENNDINNNIEDNIDENDISEEEKMQKEDASIELDIDNDNDNNVDDESSDKK